MAEQINVKDIQVKVIPSKLANEFVKKHHYSGKVVNNSKLHFGCFLNGILHGVMSYGSPMDKSKVIGLVDTGQSEKQSWNTMLELNRMAFDDYLPKNSESRCLSVSFKLIKKNAPHVKWVLSFSDGTASGDGTIYRAVGFALTKITKNGTLWVFGNGERVARMTWDSADTDQRKRIAARLHDGSIDCTLWASRAFKKMGGEPATGFQLRYIKLLDPSAKLNCPVLPFSAIDEAGAGMLRGERITRKERQGQ